MTVGDWIAVMSVGVTCVTAAASILFYGGKLVGRIEDVARRFGSMEDRLDQIPALAQRIEYQEEWLKRVDNLHNSTRVHAIRAEAISSGGFDR